MGREVRRTPVGWVPPMVDFPYGRAFQPQHDHPASYGEKLQAQERERLLAEKDEYIAKYGENDFKLDLADASEPVEARYYRPDWTAEEMNGYQLYETVTEGTPLTPSFATPEELVEHLTTIGPLFGPHDYRAKQRGSNPLTRGQAEAIVRMGWAPSLTHRDGVTRDPYETAEDSASRVDSAS